MDRDAYVRDPLKVSQEVESKYFKSDTKMDDSTSDFQVPKTFVTNNKVKQSNNKPKRKTTKKVKGQKDIRTILNKKNDLVNYSKDFDTVCRQTGIDVDSEQLQLAIAMSKSLQTCSNEPKDIAQNPMPLSSHGRAERIKNNLLKFGFKIPDVNINLEKNKKHKKIRKHSKLLTITDTERKQIIINKYTSVVIKNLNNHTFKNNNDNSLTKIYNLATKVSYTELKSLEIFYTNLVEPSPNTIGSLLKDWSEIPGRPSSPKKEVLNLNLTDLEFTDEELDMIMCKELSIAQSIVKAKLKQNRKEKIFSGHNHEEILSDKDEEKCISDDLAVKYVRTPSPDLFDDETMAEESKIIISSNESSKDDAVQNSPILSSDKTNNMIEIVENVDKEIIFNVTKEKHNISTTIISEKENVIEKIDLTQSICEKKESNEVNNDIDAMDLTQSSVSSRLSNDSLPEVFIPGLNQPKPNLKNSINNEEKNAYDVIQIEDDENKNHVFDEYVLEHSHESNDEVISGENIEKSKELEVISDIDLTQNSKSSNDDFLNKKNRQENNEKKGPSDIDLTQNSSNHDYDCQKEDYDCQKQDYDCQKQDYDYQKQDFDIDLTQNSSDHDYDCQKQDYDCQKQDYDYQKQDFDCQKQEYDCQKEDYNLGNNGEVSINYDDLNIKSISNFKSTETNINFNTSDIEFDKLMNSQNSQESSASQRDEIFEISDEELNYSIRKSTYLDSTPYKEKPPENIYTEELKEQSFMIDNDDSLPAVEIQGRKVKLRSSIKKTDNLFNIVHTPNNSEYVLKTQDVTPMQNYESMSTPERNKELDKYGLKPFKRKRAIQLLTHLYNQTHPIVENAADDLPSPSKRRKSPETKSPIKSPILSQKSSSQKSNARISPKKRSNFDLETHSEKILGKSQKSTFKSQKSPITSQKSPIKSQKTPIKSQKSPAKSQKSPIKSQKTPTKSQRMQAEEDVLINYEITRECPLVKDIFCSQEDWVFQKREKAKLHSCRVPLHIAFHNYVSCRQGVREAILRYEPINIDVVHKQLVNDGHRYDPKDLLKYLDKKCVTVKTSSNDSRNRHNHVKL